MFTAMRRTPQILGGLFCFSVMLTGLAAFTPAATTPSVWVVQDVTATMHCTTHTISQANTPRATTTATLPCPSGTITQLVSVARSIAVAHHEAYVTTPDGPAAQALLHPVKTMAGKHPAVICLASALCSGGGGGGGSSPCEQQTQWIDFGTGNVAVDGWYSTWGTSDCRAFEVYSIGLQQYWARSMWWPFNWHTSWESDNGAWLNTTISTNSWTTRFPNYWVGAGGSSEGFKEWNGWTSNDFSVQFTPR